MNIENCRGPDGAQVESICSFSGRGATHRWSAPGLNYQLYNPSSTQFVLTETDCERHTYGTPCEYICHLPRAYCLPVPLPK